MFFVLLRAWDKEKILSLHEESNSRPSDSSLRCSTTEPQRLYKHDASKVADPSSMQDACHKNFVIDLAHFWVFVAQCAEFFYPQAVPLCFQSLRGLANVSGIFENLREEGLDNITLQSHHLLITSKTWLLIVYNIVVIIIIYLFIIFLFAEFNCTDQHVIFCASNSYGLDTNARWNQTSS